MLPDWQAVCVKVGGGQFSWLIAQYKALPLDDMFGDTRKYNNIMKV